MRQDKGDQKQVVKVDKPPVGAIFIRTLALSFALFVSVFSAACWYCKGIDWILNTGKSPIVSCPSTIFNTGGMTGGDRFCAITFVYSDPLWSDLERYRDFYVCSYRTVEFRDRVDRYMDCYMPSSCDSICSYNGKECPDPSTLSPESNYGQNPAMCQISNPSTGPVTQVKCRQVAMQPYCDNRFHVTSGSIVAIRGLICGCVVIILIWLIGEFILRSVEIGLKKDVAYGRLRQADSLPAIKEQLRSIIEKRWAEQYEASRAMDMASGGSMYGETPRYGMSPMANGDYTPKSMGGSPSMHRSALESRNPKRRFESSAWNRRIKQWKELRSKKASTYKTRFILRTAFLNFLFLATIVCTMFLIIYISPSKITGSKTILSSLIDNLAIWNLHSWLDILIFVDVVLDVLMFIIACCVVHWPRAPVFAKKLNQERIVAQKSAMVEEGRMLGDAVMHAPTPDTHHSESSGSISLSVSGGFEEEVADDDAFSLVSVLKQTMTADTCLMIACHQSTITADKQETFTNTLRSAMKVFPPSHIFVCDNGGSMTPVDATQAVAQSVHPDINYLYIPEGNKTFAFYWCNRYWIPFLAQCGRVPDFKYALMTDDDVPLPADLHIPHEYLRLHPEVKAVHFAITAATPDGKPNLLVECQDIEYKMAAVHKYFQSAMARSLSCHGAIGLWERTTLDRVFYDHDTVFHGEDLYMGLSLLRLRDDSRIISCPQTIVPTYAPDNWPLLFRQRVKSWELTSHKKTFTYLFEFLHPASFCHASSLVLKPYFLQELLTIALDWLRMFLITGLLLRDWLGLLMMTAIFTSILYIQVVILQFVYLRQRKDLRSSFLTALMFPFYRLGGLVFRLCALIHNILVYSKDRKALKIGYREDEVRDIPPSPPHPDVDWFTCWIDQPTPTK